MIKIGEWNQLKVVREKEFGLYLSDETGETDVLLPIRQVPKGTKQGTVLNVFVYRDSSDRMIATTKEPKITLGELAVLKCVGITKIGAFMDWGLEKDILLPFKEQTTRVEEEKEYLVRMYKDKSDRLCVSMKVYEYLKTDSSYKVGDMIQGTVIEYNPKMGAFVAVDNLYSALLPLKEIHSRINVGDVVEGRISNVREDGKLDLSKQKPIKIQIDEDSQMVYKIIESYHGVLPFNDKADKEIIEKEFGLSKNAFKRAVGRLLKEEKIIITEKNILIKEEYHEKDH